MGIVLLLLNIDCEIPHAQIPAAFRAVKALPAGAFVEQEAIDKAETLEELLSAWRWGGGIEDKNGKWTIYDFFGEKLGSEEALFAALGPYVKSGIFILVAASDGDTGRVWRWYFEGQRMIQQEARLEFT